MNFILCAFPLWGENDSIHYYYTAIIIINRAINYNISIAVFETRNRDNALDEHDNKSLFIGHEVFRPHEVFIFYVR